MNSQMCPQKIFEGGKASLPFFSVRLLCRLPAFPVHVISSPFTSRAYLYLYRISDLVDKTSEGNKIDILPLVVRLPISPSQ